MNSRMDALEDAQLQGVLTTSAAEANKVDGGDPSSKGQKRKKRKNPGSSSSSSDSSTSDSSSSNSSSDKKKKKRRRISGDGNKDAHKESSKAMSSLREESLKQGVTQAASAMAIQGAFKALQITLSLFFGGRKKEIIKAAATCLEAYCLNKDQTTVWAEMILHKVRSLGGMFMKAAQQISQLPDVVPNPAVRRVLKQLEENNSPRDRAARQQQLQAAFPGRSFDVRDVLGTGCMGEVSKVVETRDPSTNIEMAVKTTMDTQRSASSKDREVLRTLDKDMAKVIDVFRKFDSKGAVEVETVVSKITDMAKNDDVFESLMGGFNLANEKSFTEEAGRYLADVLKRLKMEGTFSVPEMYDATETCLLMEMVKGQTLAKGGSVPDFFVNGLANVYVVMLLVYGFFHQDLHPGNSLISLSRSCVYLLDWGEIVRVPRENMEDVKLLMKYIISGEWHGKDSDSLQQLFGRLGVATKPGRRAQNENFVALANLLNITQALRGDQKEATDTMIKASVFTNPGWIEKWQKATNALAISFKAAQATPEMVQQALKQALDLPLD